MVKLHLYNDSTPIREWEPSASSTKQVDSDFIFFPITCVKFSPVRPMIFAVGSLDGCIYIYDLSANSQLPVEILQVPDRNIGYNSSNIVERKGIASIAFNSKRNNLISACDYSGRVHIWNLNWMLSNLQSNEQSKLDSITTRKYI